MQWGLSLHKHTFFFSFFFPFFFLDLTHDFYNQSLKNQTKYKGQLAGKTVQTIKITNYNILYFQLEAEKLDKWK